MNILKRDHSLNRRPFKPKYISDALYKKAFRYYAKEVMKYLPEKQHHQSIIKYRKQKYYHYYDEAM